LEFFNCEQHKGRLLIVVSFFKIYFWCTSSLSETSSGNDLSMPKFNFPWKWLTAETCSILGAIRLALTLWPPKYKKS